MEAYADIKKAKELIKKLTIIWGAKESLYKIYATHGLSFMDHIYIHDFNNTDNTTGVLSVMMGVHLTIILLFWNLKNLPVYMRLKNKRNIKNGRILIYKL